MSSFERLLRNFQQSNQQEHLRFMHTVEDVRKIFSDLLSKNRNKDVKTLETIGLTFLADNPVIFGKISQEYVKAEIDWYESQSLNIHDIWEKEPPKCWKMNASPEGIINSNYGKLIYSSEYHFQFDSCVKTLQNNPDSRRACMIYTRPSIQREYSENGKNDFICTNAVSFHLKNRKLHSVVQMRSSDLVYGYKNDYPWHLHVLNKLSKTLSSDTKVGNIIFQIQNAHVYSKHWHLIQEYIEKKNNDNRNQWTKVRDLCS